jgi:hypothetical protein
MAVDRDDYEAIPGYRLLYASSPEPSNFRLFELVDPGRESD